MTDTNELRRLAQAATPGPWHFWRGWVAADIDSDGGIIIAERPTPSGGKYQARVDGNFRFIAAANPAAITELLDRLEAAEKERDELLAKSAEMEKQEPVAVVEITYGREPECYVTGNIDNFPEGVFKLYASPVDAKAIRAEALEEAVKFLEENGMIAPNGFTAAGIRGLK